jgi:hypothetical protein
VRRSYANFIYQARIGSRLACILNSREKGRRRRATRKSEANRVFCLIYKFQLGVTTLVVDLRFASFAKPPEELSDARDPLL